MSNYDYKHRLKALRETTTIVGVIGMTASGKTEFASAVNNKDYPIFTYDVESLMDNTDIPVEELNVFPQARREQISNFSPLEIAMEMIHDYSFYKFVKNAMFDIHMNIISDKIRNAYASVPSLKEKAFVFIELPFSTNFKYNDMFDAIITLQRPETYEEGWWNNHYDTTVLQDEADKVALLKQDDKMFKELQFTEVLSLYNGSNLETFVSNCNDTIDEVVEILSSK